MLEVLTTNDFFYKIVTDDDSNRLSALFFADLRLIALFKDNNYVVIFDYIYKIYTSGLPILCFDIVISLSIVIPLTYILMPDKTFKGYE